MSIRRATPADAEAIAELEGLAAHHPWSESAVRSALESRFAIAFIDPGHSYCIAQLVAGEGELQTLAVHPDSRRCGRARSLLEALHRAWAQRGLDHAFLEVREHNVPAISLYRSLGWESVGRREGYYGRGEDALLMRYTP